MSTLKILHCADIHIGAAESFLGNLADSRRYETLLTFERIVDLAVEQSSQNPVYYVQYAYALYSLRNCP
jgi:hypothetical protein